MSTQRQVLGCGLLILLFVLPIAKLSGFITWSWWVIGGINLLLSFLFIIAGSRTKRQSAPTAEEVAILAARIRNGEGQTSSLRCLCFRVPPGWSCQKAAFGERETSYAGSELVLLPIDVGHGINIHISVAWVSSQAEEDNTPTGMQRFAESYAKEQGVTLLRNDIRLLAGVYGVDFEYTTPGGQHRRKIVTTWHRSEYVITINAENSSIWGVMLLVIETFLGTFSTYQPHLPRQTVLDERVQIGIPANWKRVEDTANSATWRSDMGETKLWLRLVGEDKGATFTAKLFKGVEGSLFQHQELRSAYYNLPETGVSAIVCELTEPYRGEQRYRCAHAIRVPTGLQMVLDFEHIGSDRVMFDGLVLQPYVLEIVATIEDARAA
jgi:hypothetical protein